MRTLDISLVKIISARYKIIMKKKWEGGGRRGSKEEWAIMSEEFCKSCIPVKGKLEWRSG